MRSLSSIVVLRLPPKAPPDALKVPNRTLPLRPARMGADEDEDALVAALTGGCARPFRSARPDRSPRRWLRKISGVSWRPLLVGQHWFWLAGQCSRPGVRA